ncbi:MAG: helix-turn-helix domain-containing protein [Candidatus Gastranaerophilaceae bacterium]|nr:helix-turn-helix transcriptional regulator [Christensenellales bacterium]
MYLCVHQTTYSEYELGKLSVPVEVFIKLSRLYGVSVEYMLGLTGERLIPCADIKSP